MITFCDTKKLHASHGYFFPSSTACLCFPRLSFCVKRKSHVSHGYLFLHAPIVYVFLILLFVTERSYMHYMDEISFHAQIAYVSLGFLLELQKRRKHHMDISSLNAQILYVFQEFLFVSKGSHKHHMDIFLHAQIILRITFCDAKKLHALHIVFGVAVQNTIPPYFLTTILYFDTKKKSSYWCKSVYTIYKHINHWQFFLCVFM